MFGKKPQETTNEEPALDVSVTTIPSDFYAGANPTITFKKVEKVIEANDQGIIFSGEKPPVIEPVAAIASPDHPVHILSNKKKLFALGAGFFGLCILGSAGFYWMQYRANVKPAPKTPPQPVVVVTQPEPENTIVTTTVEEVAPTTTVEIVTPTTTIDLADTSIEFPPLFLGKGVDMDNDRLTDQEDELFKSDPGNPDTDGDSYLDGSEVYHLYNPVGKEPIKLIESNLVKEFENPSFGYSVYYPSPWVTGNVNQDYRDMLFSTITGENIEIRAFDKPSSQAFADWFALTIPSQKYGDLIDFETRFGDKAFRRYDKLVYYFTTTDRVFVIIYHQAVNGETLTYPAVAEMMARSFRVSGQTTTTLQTLPPLTVDDGREVVETVEEGVASSTESQTTTESVSQDTASTSITSNGMSSTSTSSSVQNVSTKPL